MANLIIDFIDFIIVLFWIIYMFLNKLEYPKTQTQPKTQFNNNNSNSNSNCNCTCIMCCPTYKNIQNYNQQIMDSESYTN